jgi:hypothetical protein
MSDILGDLAGGVLGGLATAVDALGEGAELTGEEVQKLGQLIERLSDIMRAAQGRLAGLGEG